MGIVRLGCVLYVRLLRGGGGGGGGAVVVVVVVKSRNVGAAPRFCI